MTSATLDPTAKRGPSFAAFVPDATTTTKKGRAAKSRTRPAAQVPDTDPSNGQPMESRLMTALTEVERGARLAQILHGMLERQGLREEAALAWEIFAGDSDAAERMGELVGVEVLADIG